MTLETRESSKMPTPAAYLLCPFSHSSSISSHFHCSVSCLLPSVCQPVVSLALCRPLLIFNLCFLLAPTFQRPHPSPLSSTCLMATNGFRPLLAYPCADEPLPRGQLKPKAHPAASHQVCFVFFIGFLSPTDRPNPMRPNPLTPTADFNFRSSGGTRDFFPLPPPLPFCFYLLILFIPLDG